jgi:plasmid stability protein
MSEQSTPTVAPPSGAVTIRGLAPDLKNRLRVRAAHNDRSMEAEARAILEAAVASPEEDPTDLAAFARGLFAPLGGVELDLPAREPARDPPTFTGGDDPAPSPGPARGSLKGGARRVGAVAQGASPKTAGRRR